MSHNRDVTEPRGGGERKLSSAPRIFQNLTKDNYCELKRFQLASVFL
jgi:hypothetical protein